MITDHCYRSYDEEPGTVFQESSFDELHEVFEKELFEQTETNLTARERKKANPVNNESSEEEDQEELRVLSDDEILKAIFSSENQILKPDFVRKFIQTASQVKTKLSPEATELLNANYRKMRDNQDMGEHYARINFVTPRSLEASIRIAEAVAKAELSTIVTNRHANIAIEILTSCYSMKVATENQNEFCTEINDNLKTLEQQLLKYQRGKNSADFLNLNGFLSFVEAEKKLKKVKSKIYFLIADVYLFIFLERSNGSS